MAANRCCMLGHESCETVVCGKECLVLSGVSVESDVRPR